MICPPLGESDLLGQILHEPTQYDAWSLIWLIMNESDRFG